MNIFILLYLILFFETFSMEKPDKKYAYLISPTQASEFTDSSSWLSIPRLTFMALLLEAHRNQELNKKSFQELLKRLRANAIGYDEDRSAFTVSPIEFYNGLLQYIPWDGKVDECVIPRRYKIRLFDIPTAFTVGTSWHLPTQIEAHAIEELSPEHRQELVRRFNEVLKS